MYAMTADALPSFPDPLLQTFAQHLLAAHANAQGDWSITEIRMFFAARESGGLGNALMCHEGLTRVTALFVGNAYVVLVATCAAASSCQPLILVLASEPRGSG